MTKWTSTVYRVLASALLVALWWGGPRPTTLTETALVVVCMLLVLLVGVLTDEPWRRARVMEAERSRLRPGWLGGRRERGRP